VTLLEIIRPFSGRNFKFTTRIPNAVITVQPARRICSFLPPKVFNLAAPTVHSVPSYSYHAERVNGEITQEVKIFYNCIGAFDVPDRESIPELEVLIETRKGVALSYSPIKRAG